jgi:hypothetical protein
VRARQGEAIKRFRQHDRDEVEIVLDLLRNAAALLSEEGGFAMPRLPGFPVNYFLAGASSDD